MGRRTFVLAIAMACVLAGAAIALSASADQVPAPPPSLLHLTSSQVPIVAPLQQLAVANSIQLITCPQLHPYTVGNYFLTANNIGGNACLAQLKQLETLVSMSGTASYDTQLRFGGQDTFLKYILQYATSMISSGFTSGLVAPILLSTNPASVNKISFSVGIQPQSSFTVLGHNVQLPPSVMEVVTNKLFLGGAAAVLIQNLGFVGQVQLPDGSNAIASSYNTKSYVFQEPPASVQQGLWSWTAEYVNLSKIPSSAFNYQLPKQSTNLVELRLGIDLTRSADVITGGPVFASLFTCTYSYDYTYTISNSVMANIGVPVPNAISVNGKPVTNVPEQFNDTFLLQYNTPTITNWAIANVLPLLDYNISMPASTSNLNSQVSYLNQSFMLYSPHNLLDAANFLEPYRIDLGAGLLANTGGYLVEFPYNVIDLSALNPLTINTVEPITMFISSAFGSGSDAFSAYANLFGTKPDSNGKYCPYNKLVTTLSCAKPITMGSLIGMYVRDPQYIFAAPNGDIYVINYTHTPGFLDFNQKTTANLYTLRFYPFGQFNPPEHIPNPLGSGFQPMSGISISTTPSLKDTSLPGGGGQSRVSPTSLASITAVDIGQTVATMQASWTGGMPPYTVTWTYGTSQQCSADTNVALVDNAAGGLQDSLVIPQNPNPTDLTNWPAAGLYYYCASVADSFGDTKVSDPIALVVSSPFQYSGTTFNTGYLAAARPAAGYPKFEAPEAMCGLSASLGNGAYCDYVNVFGFPGGYILQVPQRSDIASGLGFDVNWNGGTPPYTVSLYQVLYTAPPYHGIVVPTDAQAAAGYSSAATQASLIIPPCGAATTSVVEPTVSSTVGNTFQLSFSPVGGAISVVMVDSQQVLGGTLATLVSDEQAIQQASGTQKTGMQWYCTYLQDATGQLFMSENTMWQSNLGLDITGYGGVGSLGGSSSSDALGTLPRATTDSMQGGTVQASNALASVEGAFPSASSLQLGPSASPQIVSYPVLPSTNGASTDAQQIQSSAAIPFASPPMPSSLKSICDTSVKACSQWIQSWTGYWQNLTIEQSGNLYVVGEMNLSEQRSTLWGIYSLFNKAPSGGSSPTSQTQLQTSSTAVCPDQVYETSPFVVLTIEQVIACAQNAGFTGTQLTQIVSIASAESSFKPGATGKGISSGCYARGILQEGKCSTAPGEAYTLSNYDPTTCPTYNGDKSGTSTDDWNGIYYNPTCAFQWAYAFVQHSPAITQSGCTDATGGTPFCFWGSYWNPSSGTEAAYCKYAPTTYSGHDCQSGGGVLAWTNVPTQSAAATSTQVSTGPFDFLPTAITVDDSGDLFLVGQGSKGLTFGVLSANGLMLSGTAVFQDSSFGKSFEPSAAFAVSSGGQFGYVIGHEGSSANSGNILVFNMKTFQQVGSISLSYSTSNYNLDISKYLKDGGPYGNHALESAYKDFTPNYDTGSNHIPLSLSESHGTLYVLDLWSFSFTVGSSKNEYPGRMLMLRAFNENGTEVQVNPTTVNDITAKSAAVGIAVPAFSANPSAPSYPPYGWPLSVNVSTTDSSGVKGFLSYCIAGCTSVLVPPEKPEVYAAYPPIGPWMPNKGPVQPGTSVQIFSNGGTSTVGFQVNYANVGYLLAHVELKDTPYTELLAVHVGTSNYTNPSFMANAGFACYITHPAGKTYATPCTSYAVSSQAGNALELMQEPLLGIPDAFKYVESQSSPEQYVTLPSASGTLSQLIGNGNSQSNAANSIAETGCSPTDTKCTGGLTIASLTTGGTPQSVSAAVLPQEYLKSTISGYIAVPYVSTFKETQYYFNIQKSILQQPAGTQPPGTAPVIGLKTSICDYDFTKLACSQSPCRISMYGYSMVKAEPSNTVATFASGPTYLAYNTSNFNDYYKPNLSDAGAIMPPNIKFNIYTNRVLGEVYVNQSVKPNPDFAAFTGKLQGDTTLLNNILIGQSQLIPSPGSAVEPMLVVNQSHLYSYTPQFFYQLTLTPLALVGPAYALEVVVSDVYSGLAAIGQLIPVVNAPPADVTNTINPPLVMHGLPLFYFADDTANAVILSAQAAQCAVPGFQQTAQCNSNIQFGEVQNALPTQLQLFDSIQTLYKQYSLSLNWSGNNNILGYNRFIYTFVDAFNNTIYAPLDVDLANATAINMQVNASVSTTNPNQTIVTVKGNAGYYQGLLQNQFAPLPEGSQIYLYYDQNFNYFDPNHDIPGAPDELYTNYVQQCAFGNANGCTLANPLNMSQETLNLEVGQNVYASIPMYYSPTSCPGQPDSLLSTSYLSSLYECNIYGNYNLPKTCADVRTKAPSTEPQGCASQAQTQLGHMSNDCILYNDNQMCSAADSASATLYCVPNFDNGTGTFTSQIGLLPSKTHTITSVANAIINGGTTQTDSNGNFIYSFTVCGSGSGKILASYYGAPFPQPVSVTQSPLSLSAVPNSKLPASQQVTSMQYAYTFMPASAAGAFLLGSYALSFGSLETPIAIAAVAAVIIALLLRSRSRRPQARRARRR